MVADWANLPVTSARLGGEDDREEPLARGCSVQPSLREPAGFAADVLHTPDHAGKQGLIGRYTLHPRVSVDGELGQQRRYVRRNRNPPCPNEFAAL